MPKKVRRDKRGSAPLRTGAGPSSRRLDSVKELLGARVPVLKRVTAQAERAHFWTEWLSSHLPPELRARVSGVVERDRTLVIFAESAAWSARLRYSVRDLDAEIRAAGARLAAVEVRVRPR